MKYNAYRGRYKKGYTATIKKYGTLNTTEVKEKLSQIIAYDNEDILPSGTRINEVLITQRIGNIVSHQYDLVMDYPEGFRVDKSYTPAIFSLI